MVKDTGGRCGLRFVVGNKRGRRGGGLVVRDKEGC